MKIHITNTYNVPKAAGQSQQKTTKIAREMGFLELDLFQYDAKVDNDVELGKRIDGIVASIQRGDIVFFQSPSWNLLRYDSRLVRQLKAYKNLKLAIFVHDVTPMMFGWGEAHIRQAVEIYNYADLIIVASEAILEVLRKHGLTVKKQMVQKMWDFPIDYELNTPKLEKRLFFSGTPERFPFINDWTYKTPMVLYRDMNLDNPNLNIEVRGYQQETQFLLGLSEGGYGLVWSSNEANDYYKMLQPYKVATFLAAGIPVIMQRGLVPERIILDNKVGFVVDSLEEADAIVQNTTEAEYTEMVNRISEFNFLVKNGWFTRKMLTDAVMWLLNDNYQPDTAVISAKKELASIQVRGIHDSLDFIIKNKSSVVRFGDGEINIISGSSIPYQQYDVSLAKYLKKIIGMSSTEQMLVCLPDVFERQERYNDFCKDFWRGHLSYYKELYKEICKADWYGSTFISRPYIDLQDKSESAGYFEHLKQLWKERDLLLVEGCTSRVGVGNDLFDEVKSIKRIICPSKDAWFQYGEILENTMKYAEKRLVLIMLGPTAKVLAYELAMRGYQAIDLGHIDSEYEWFQMGATHKVKLPNKHTAEHNYDENIVFEEDSEYKSQIVYSCV